MSETPKKILALGDSYTVGERVRSNERWITVLSHELRDAGLVINTPRVVAKSAWTTDELLHHLELARPDSDHDLVTLMIGVNNQYRGRGVRDFELDARDLIAHAIQFGCEQPRRVLVVSIPDWGVTPFAKDRNRADIAGEIDEFNQSLHAAAIEAGVAFVDVTPISRRECDEPGWIADDDLHPGPAMHRAWADQIRPTAQSILTAN